MGLCVQAPDSEGLQLPAKQSQSLHSGCFILLEEGLLVIIRQISIQLW